MSTVGLTKAMREALEFVRDFGCLPSKTDRRGKWLTDAGLIAPINRGRAVLIATPRGHAALAAPRMTQAELAYLLPFHTGAQYCYFRREERMFKRLVARGWLREIGADYGELTPAGRTALNNVRAAMGSPDYKEGL